MSADYLQVISERRGGVCVLTVCGELDFQVCGVFAEQAARAAGELCGPVRMDLSGLVFVDCCGARTLAMVTGDILASRPLIICPGPPPHVRRVLDLLGLGLGGEHPDEEPGRVLARGADGSRHADRQLSR